ncbi:hypothetical protein NGM10_00335 [Halorussus salilacus]|uniref:hypothetical protein n=1 Tax=Halorussus salilacus TaxID=2953750 RepID=UPI00209FB9E2|nr:hypothetical protein [Halorussus salilacus]USZ68206.1 hypothetical protein NGM10_00335 [Halorussus salilacus]
MLRRVAALRRPAAFLALALAVVLVANPAYLSFWHTSYSHHVEEVPDSEIPEEADVLAYEDLSPDAQHAVRKSVEGDGSHVVYREGNVPGEFFYSDHASLGRGIYFVEYRGGYYELNTMAGGGFAFYYWFYEALLAGFGLAVGVVGYRTSNGDESPLLALGLTALGVALLLTSPLTRFPAGEGVWTTAVVVAFGVGALAALWPRVRPMSTADR